MSDREMFSLIEDLKNIVIDAQAFIEEMQDITDNSANDEEEFEGLRTLADSGETLLLQQRMAEILEDMRIEDVG